MVVGGALATSAAIIIHVVVGVMVVTASPAALAVSHISLIFRV